MKTLTLTDAEHEVLVYFLSELSDQFGNDGCNDMTFKDTPGNRKLVTEAEIEMGMQDDDYEPKTYGKNDELYTNNIVILEFLADKIKNAKND